VEYRLLSTERTEVRRPPSPVNPQAAATWLGLSVHRALPHILLSFLSKLAVLATPKSLSLARAPLLCTLPSRRRIEARKTKGELLSF
jgi:hypothetical protein